MRGESSPGDQEGGGHLQLPTLRSCCCDFPRHGPVRESRPHQKYLAQMNARLRSLRTCWRCGYAHSESVLPRLDAFSELFESANR